MPSKKQPRKQRRQLPLPEVKPSFAVDPLSDLVSATELRIWRSQPTTQKVLRYLTRWRGVLVEQLAEGGSTAPSCEATALSTAEYVAKAQLLKDVITLEPKDVADFYGLAAPEDQPTKEKQ